MHIWPALDPQRRSFLRGLGAAAVVANAGRKSFAGRSEGAERCSSEHVAWVTQALQRMQTIHVGMTRADLMTVFTTEGGLSTGLQRTFVSRDCPFFKVDVTFRRAKERPAEEGERRFLAEYEDDVMASVSRPYLQFSTFD